MRTGGRMMRSKRTFLFDRMLGKLCRKMRLLGYDAKINPEGETGRFLVNAEQEGRTAVTRSTRHQDRPGRPAVVLESTGSLEQIAELFKSLGEPPHFEPFTRCIECNTALVEESPSSVRGEVPPYIEERFKRFHRCPECRRIYWEGSHYQAMAEEIKSIEEITGKGP
jgi:uncharacterized protein with PIN domain